MHGWVTQGIETTPAEGHKASTHHVITRDGKRVIDITSLGVP
jgi:hypothetical protein